MLHSGVVADPLLEIFAEGLGLSADALAEDSSPDTVEEWDSLNHIRLVVAVEKRLRLKFSAAEVGRLKNVGEFAALIQSRAMA